MRIAFYGNICNNHYQIAKAIRLRSDLDVHLYIDRDANPQELPESDDPELRNAYPHWIHRGHYIRALDKVMLWRAPLVRELANYDVVVVSGLGPAFAQFTGKPVAFLSAGADLTMAAFPIRFLSRHKTWMLKAKALWVGPWQRRGIRRCAEVWTQPFAPFRDAVKAVGLAPDRVTPVYFPVMIDTERITEHPAPRESGVAAVGEIVSRFDFVVFHPSRLMMRDTPETRATGQWKGNDVLIRAFARFLAETGAKRAGLVLIDRPASPDIEEARRLIAELGIAENVLWLQPPTTFGFSRAELMAIYSISNVVADDFGIGWFGSIVLEGMAARRPVLCHVDDDAMKQLYPWHPILSDATVAGNTELLKRLYRDPAYARAVGEEGRRWVEQFHAPESASRIYVQQIREMIERFRVSSTSAAAVDALSQ